MSGSTKPYLIRALYDWCVDNQQTPYISVWVDEHTRVPMQYVRDNEIMLSVSPTACQNLKIDNDWIHLVARFGGVPHEIWIPVGNVISIFAKETGEGMGFEIEKMQTEKEGEAHLEELGAARDIPEISDEEDVKTGNLNKPVSDIAPSHLRILK